MAPGRSGCCRQATCDQGIKRWGTEEKREKTSREQSRGQGVRRGDNGRQRTVLPYRGGREVPAPHDSTHSWVRPVSALRPVGMVPLRLLYTVVVKPPAHRGIEPVDAKEKREISIYFHGTYTHAAGAAGLNAQFRKAGAGAQGARNGACEASAGSTNGLSSARAGLAGGVVAFDRVERCLERLCLGGRDHEHEEQELHALA